MGQTDVLEWCSQSFLAHQGNVEEVDHYFRDFNDSSPHRLDLQLLKPRLYVHAISGDVDSTKVAFDQIEKVYDMQPDATCWNILMYAHSRSSEPQKVFEIFDEMTAQGMEPDAYTFGTLAGVASNSGDTNRTLSLLDLASQYNIPRTGEMLAGVVHSLCLNDQLGETVSQMSRRESH